MTEQLQNFGNTTLNGGLDASTTSVVVTDGSVFPSSGNFRIKIESELMLVTARSSNTLTVTRGAESTTAASHSDATTVRAVLTAAGLTTAIQELSYNPSRLGAIFDSIAADDQLDIVVPFDCTITNVTMLADTTGSCVIDIWKDTYANFPPTDADTITASAVPTISSAVKSTDSTLTGWTTSLSASDILRFNVDSASTLTRVAIFLTVSPT